MTRDEKPAAKTIPPKRLQVLPTGNVHRNTMRSLADFTAAAGLRHPGEFTPEKIWQRSKPFEIRRFSQLYEFMEPGQLLEGQPPEALAHSWEASRSDSFSGR